MKVLLSDRAINRVYLNRLSQLSFSCRAEYWIVFAYVYSDFFQTFTPKKNSKGVVPKAKMRLHMHR